MELLDKYFKLQQEIYDYFGYVEDWVVIPINDGRKYYWWLDQNDDGRGRVHFSEKQLSINEILDGNELYGDIIYTQSFLPRWVYRGEDYTMICVDTRTDGNKFLEVFDNEKELNPTIEEINAFRFWDIL